VPGKKHFIKVSSSKDYDSDIIRPIKLMAKLAAKGGPAEGVKCTTQFIVGASDETDADIIKYMLGLYERLKFKRVYFSAYQPGLGDPSLPGEGGFQLRNSSGSLLNREHRLYQADFLMRRYGFSTNDIPLNSEGFLSLDKDPKLLWAEAHPERFPVDLNKATKEELLRVPGIGPQGAEMLVKRRLSGNLSSLGNLGIKGKRLALISRYAIV